MDAMERAQELMLEPRWKLPYVCFMYAKELCQRYGMCGEVLLTAYSHYANYMEKLPCDEVEYKADAFAKQFFDKIVSGG